MYLTFTTLSLFSSFYYEDHFQGGEAHLLYVLSYQQLLNVFIMSLLSSLRSSYIHESFVSSVFVNVFVSVKPVLDMKLVNFTEIDQNLSIVIYNVFSEPTILCLFLHPTLVHITKQNYFSVKLFLHYSDLRLVFLYADI